jgi:prepilin-type N-terminal cleavage/methylation domain-containing protein/prepilin-type processing-associated H-X9-DG protein
MKRHTVRRANEPRGQGGRPRRRGFTLTELLVVVGLIAVLISLLLPVLGRVRAAANAAACMSNLRQMHTAWTMYLTEHRGRLPVHVQYNPPVTPPSQLEVSWRSYWLGVLDSYRVRGGALLCAAAPEPIAYSQTGAKGAGNVNYAWTGRHMSAGVARLNTTTFRTGSYGYNGRLVPLGGYGSDLKASRINQVRRLTEVPVFFDCTQLDAVPDNGDPSLPVQSPGDLRGETPIGAPNHWRFLIARHGRAINVAFADGSVGRVPLEETYQLEWSGAWKKYRLSLPPF